MGTELLHFHRAVSLCSVITGRNRHLNWQIKQRMSGIDAEPRAPRHNRFKDREISSHMERGEEIRGVRRRGNRHQHFFSLSAPLVLSPSSSPLPSPLCLLSSSGTGFGSRFVFFDSFSPSLFPPRLLSLGFAAMVTTSSLHEVHLQRTGGGVGRGGCAGWGNGE